MDNLNLNPNSTAVKSDSNDSVSFSSGLSNADAQVLNFRTPEDEIKYLRQEIAKREQALSNLPRKMTQEEHAAAVVREHSSAPVQSVIESPVQHKSEIAALVNSLGKKENNLQVIELGNIMLDKGVRFAIDLARNIKQPELEDDFHKFLVNYLLSGHDDAYNKLDKAEWRALHLKLFEITPPAFNEADSHGDSGNVKSKIQLMEQLYSTLQIIGDSEKNEEYFSLELAKSNDSGEVVFYVAVPKSVEDVFEKTLQGYFPGIQVKLKSDDYNIFNDKGYQVCSKARMHESPILPIKTYKNLEGDPITVIMNSFTKLKHKGEGASMQILVRPTGNTFKKQYIKILDDMQKNNDSFKRAIERNKGGIGGALFSVKESFKSKEEIDKEKAKERNYEDTERVKLINEKLTSTIVDTNIRILASAESSERAEYILNDIKASFKQYTENNGNFVEFEDYKLKNLNEEARKFIFRIWSNEESLPLNLSELATLYHIPTYIKDFHQVKISQMLTAPAPLGMAQEGVLLGYNEYRGLKTPVYLGREDRMRHLYVIGQTGTGKTVTLKNLIIQDILNGDGCCMIDPHGDDVEEILANVPPERYEDVIYFDPGSTEMPMGLNMLEYDPAHPEFKTLIVNEMLGIFDKLFDMKTSGGPGFEQYFRNSTLLVMEHPDSGNTILDIARVLSDKDYRDYKLSKCKNPLIIQFWKNAEQTTGEQGLQNWVPHVNSKFDNFLSNEILRPIVSQEKSSFNIRDIMDNKKIFLVNLSKGKLGELGAYLIGLILVGKFAQAALSRVDSKERPDFYLYLDEFQNVTTPAISSILSEARKYRLSLNVAHQFIGQLPEEIKNAVFGNIGSMCINRVGPEDAKFLESQLSPVFKAEDIMRVENLNCYAKILSNGTPQKPFSMKIPFNSRGNKDVVPKLKELSMLKYGRLRAEVEEEILMKYEY